MNLLVGMIYAWMIVYAVLGVYFILLGGRQRVSRDYLVFGLMCGVEGLYALASIRQYLAIDAVAGLRWASIRLVLGSIVSALLVSFILRVSNATGWRAAMARPGGIALLAVPQLAIIASAWLDSGVHWQMLHASGTPIRFMVVDFRPLFLLCMVPIGVGLTVGIDALLRAARRGVPGLRAIAVAVLFMLAVAVHDFAIWAFGLPDFYYNEHAYFGFAIIVAYVLTTRLAEELSTRTEELKALQQTLRSVRETLEKKEQLAAVGELSAIVAHEIRNPLGVLANAVASLRRPELSSTDRLLLLGILDEETSRMNRIVTDLLQLARPISPELRPLDPSDLVDRALGSARATDTSVTVKVSDDAAHPMRADAHLMRQALENLVDNAVQAMGDRGELTVLVRTVCEGDRVGREIAVIDTGEGMNTDVRSRARDAFFTTRATGTGLGLAIVDRIVRAHGGRMEIQSARNKGTTVRVWLPDAEATGV